MYILASIQHTSRFELDQSTILPGYVSSAQIYRCVHYKSQGVILDWAIEDVRTRISLDRAWNIWTAAKEAVLASAADNRTNNARTLGHGKYRRRQASLRCTSADLSPPRTTRPHICMDLVEFSDVTEAITTALDQDIYQKA
jgi:hypothetical protein